MGYYSDVRVSTTQEGFEFLKACCKEHDLFGGYGYVEERNDETGVVFGWNDVKWYHSFPDVAEFRKSLCMAEDEGIPFEYIELGEDGATDTWFSSDDGCFWESSGLSVHVGIVHRIEVWEG